MGVRYSIPYSIYIYITYTSKRYSVGARLSGRTRYCCNRSVITRCNLAVSDMYMSVFGKDAPDSLYVLRGSKSPALAGDLPLYSSFLSYLPLSRFSLASSRYGGNRRGHIHFAGARRRSLIISVISRSCYDFYYVGSKDAFI